MAAQFDGRVAFVTGGGSGIGRATARAFAREGARVVLADIRDERSNETVDLIRQDGGDAIFVRCDVTSSSDVAAAIGTTVERFGRLDFACNNAGVGGRTAPTADYTEEEWNRVIAINLTGVWLCMKHQLPVMLSAGGGGGAIVNVASILGLVGYANACAYVSAKHALLGLTKTAALEYATRKVRINAVCPGFVYTPLLERAGIAPGSDAYNAIAASHPVKRMGTPEEIAEPIIWLCSDKASFVTGQALLADGGYVAQ